MTMTDTAPAAQPEASPTAAGDDRLRALEEQIRDLDRRVENNRLIRDTWTLIIFAIAAVALLAAVIAVGFGMRAIDEAEHHAAAMLTTVAGSLT
jgi:anti-sigma-K factor RskA